MTHPNDELKACPFCGNVPALDDDGTLARCATSGCPLACYGFCIDAWNARAKDEVKVREVLALTPERPLFGQVSGRGHMTHWLVFMKRGASTNV